LKSGTLYNLLNYYINCIGINPFQEPYDNVNNSLNVFSNVLTNAQQVSSSSQSPSCPTYISNAQIQLVTMKKGLSILLEVFNCSIFSNAWKKFVEIGICDDSLKGFFILWISHIGIAWGIAMSMFLGSLVWQYFDDKNINSIKHYDDDEESSPGFSVVPSNGYMDDDDDKE
jgi:hypothetical protein